MKAQVYAKSALDLHSKDGVYSYTLICGTALSQSWRKFKKKPRTMTAADCAAYANALFFLSKEEYARELTEIELCTDSGKVGDLFSIYKAEKGCEEIARYWMQLRSDFPKLQKVSITKVDRQDCISLNGTRLNRCRLKVEQEIKIIKELVR